MCWCTSNRSNLPDFDPAGLRIAISRLRVGLFEPRLRTSRSENMAPLKLFGTVFAIISVVNTWTIALAAFVVVTHCVVIFWPRKPLTVPLDENGQPILWRNETEQKKDVTCVWWGEPVQGSTAPASNKANPATAESVPISSESPQPLPLPVTSFSDTVRPLASQVEESRRSVA